jgi:crotonobetainyl-CoA:carnitine CoA-transferase CaiB-like acyl-CoA transferase
MERSANPGGIVVDNTELSPCAEGASIVTGDIWTAAGMPAARLNDLSLSGEKPLLSSSFHVGVMAQSSIACAALAAAELGYRRNGRAQQVAVDMHDAEYECTGFFSIDGNVPPVWAPLSGLYPCADGHVRIHANFDHHRDGVLRLLAIGGDPTSVTQQHVTDALTGWRANEFESAAANAGLVVSAARRFDAWDRMPQAKVLRQQPLISFEQIGDADPMEMPALGQDARPLTGMNVLDLTRILAGPVCGRTLAAYGASVMLVNSPDLPNISSIAETSRGKLSSLIDLRTGNGADQLRSLVEGAHIFVQGYRPGGLSELGFGAAELAGLHPGIIVLSLSAYGHEGPWRQRRGFDSLVQTATGFNVAEAEAFGSDRPRALPVQILDYATGFLMAFAAQVALMRQHQTGGSWHVRLSLARTAQYLRDLGQIPVDHTTTVIKPADRAVEYSSGYGRLMAIPHAARLAATPAGWKRNAVPPGAHAPSWQA